MGHSYIHVYDKRRHKNEQIAVLASYPFQIIQI